MSMRRDVEGGLSLGWRLSVSGHDSPSMGMLIPHVRVCATAAKAWDLAGGLGIFQGWITRGSRGEGGRGGVDGEALKGLNGGSVVLGVERVGRRWSTLVATRAGQYGAVRRQEWELGGRNVSAMGFRPGSQCTYNNRPIGQRAWYLIPIPWLACLPEEEIKHLHGTIK